MMMPATGARLQRGLAPEILDVLGHCRTALLSAGVFSGLINMLALSSSIYMLQVYDRVIPSHSVPTLIGLSIAMLMLFAAYAVLDVIRTRMMGRIAVRIDRALRDRVMQLVLRLPLRAGPAADGLQPVRDVDQIRGFMASGAPVALFDMPWMPFYLALVWLLHPWLGILATAGALVLVALTVLTEMRGRAPTGDMSLSGAQRMVLAEAARRNAAAIQAMGMSHRMISRWDRASERYLADQTAATDVISTYGSISRVLRLLLQSAVLGLGAYLVIIGQGSGGVMIAASILVSRALAPIEIAIANWRGFISARQSAARLSELLRAQPLQPDPLALPAPVATLQVEGLWVAPPGMQQPVVHGATLQLSRGMALGVIGPSAAGKSTFARALIGAWPAARGTVRLDGAALDQWSSDDLGAHIGYLPQEIELLDGTVAENIARFEPEAPAQAVIEAGQQAGVHDMIVRLPNGYDTRLGEGGMALSAGQRQRVALARALYRQPFLVVLDEPNSNLDRDGDEALERAIASVRKRGGIAVIIAHRPSVLASVDHLLVMTPGQQPLFGPREDMLRKLGPGGQVSSPSATPHAPPKAAAFPPRPPAPTPPFRPSPAQPLAPLPSPTAHAQMQQDNGVRLRINTDA